MKIYYKLLLVLMIYTSGCVTTKINEFSPTEIRTLTGILYDKYMYKSADPKGIQPPFGFWLFQEKLKANDSLFSIIDPVSISTIPFRCSKIKQVSKYFQDKKISIPLFEVEKYNNENWYQDTLTNDLYNLYALKCEAVEQIKPYCSLDKNVFSKQERLQFYCPSPFDTFRYPLLIAAKIWDIKRLTLEEAKRGLNISTLKPISTRGLTFLECQ